VVNYKVICDYVIVPTDMRMMYVWSCFVVCNLLDLCFLRERVNQEHVAITETSQIRR